MSTKKRLILITCYILATILSLVGILFCSVQPDKSFNFLNPSQFFGVFALIVSLMNAFYLFFSKEENVPLWISFPTLGVTCFGILLLFLTFLFGFPIFDPSNSVWEVFATSDVLYLGLFVPLLLFGLYLFTPKKVKNIYISSLFGLPFVLFYIIIASIYFAITKDLSGLLVSSQRILRLSFFDDSLLGVSSFIYAFICLCLSYGFALLCEFINSKINIKKTKNNCKTGIISSNNEDF